MYKQVIFIAICVCSKPEELVPFRELKELHRNAAYFSQPPSDISNCKQCSKILRFESFL